MRERSVGRGNTRASGCASSSAVGTQASRERDSRRRRRLGKGMDGRVPHCWGFGFIKTINKGMV